MTGGARIDTFLWKGEFMKQRVYVQGREMRPMRVMSDYVPPNDRNSFSEIRFSQIGSSEVVDRKGFHVRQIGNGIQFDDVNEWKRKCKG